jgi:mRNA interferase MazF
MLLCCPVTGTRKGYPFEVALPENLGITGMVLADQIKNLDWRARQAEICDRVPPVVVAEVIGKLATLLQEGSP